MKRVLIILLMALAGWFVYDWRQSDGHPAWRPSGTRPTLPSIPLLSTSPSPPPQPTAEEDAPDPVETVAAQGRATANQLTASLQAGGPQAANQASSFNREWLAQQSDLTPQQVAAARRLNRIFTEMEAERTRRQQALRDIKDRPYQSFRADGAERTREFFVDDMERQWNAYVAEKQTQINRLLRELEAGR